MTKYWIGVVQREHVLRGVELGIAQSNHGARAGLSRMQPADGFAYYSPKTSYPDGAPLKAFTALGVVEDAEPWQADEGSFKPWRRAVRYEQSAREAAIEPLLGELELTRGNRNWGFVLRRGLFEVSAHDFAVIRAAMNVESGLPHR